MSKKFNVEASINGDVLLLNVTGRIWQGELADVIRLNIDNAIENGVEKLQVFMSCEGGSTFEAEDVKNEFSRMKFRKIKVGALAASAATNILTAFQEVEAFAASQFMIHKPHSWFSGNEDEVAADLKLLKNITDSYRAVYAQKFNKTEAEIEELWKNDYWMTAAEAKELGLITTIVDEQLDYTPETISAMVACGCPTVPKPSPENKNSNKNKMDINQLKAALGMPADATEEQVLARVSENKTKADNAASVEANVTRQRTEAAERVVNAAILEKKITADMKATYVGLHMQDAVKTEEILASMKGVKPASDTIVDAAAGAVTGRENWSLEDYLEKDPKGLDALAVSDPEAVKNLNAIYASKK